MRGRLGFAFGLIGLVLWASGCGGGGGGTTGSTVAPATVASPFFGRWEGSWQDSLSESGTLNLTVGLDGKLFGSFYNQTNGESVGTSGQVTASGQLTASYQYPQSDPVSVTGVVAAMPGAILQGNIQMQQNGRTIAIGSFSLTKQ